MTVMEWILWFFVVTFYVVCLFTVCLVTFRKGHMVLGIVGIFLPILWVIGAVLPARPGSAHEREFRSVPPAAA